MTLRTLAILSLSIFTLQAELNSQPKSDNSDLRNDEPIYQKFENTCERDLVIQTYEDEYLVTAISTAELAWTGNIDECKEGEISELALNRTRDRINYFRRLVGISNGIVFTEEKNMKCQKAVLMMDAANMLDHYPTADWLCATDDGIQAAGKSNLSYGGHSSASVPQYIRDAGQYNGAVGHRRWILYPKAYEFGFGSTNWGTAMWVIGGNQNPETYPEYVAYPSPGYFPKPLMYPRWSFSKKGANYASANVSMQDEEGRPIELIIEEVVNGYGDNTLVWQPEINLYDNEAGTDHYFQVTIDSMKVGGEYVSYNYEVMAIDMMQQEPVITMSSPSCKDESGSITLDIVTGYQTLEWSNGIQNQATIGNLAAGSYSVTITDKLGCASVLNVNLVDDKAPKSLEEITGNTSSSSGSLEKYSVEVVGNGSYEWIVSGGVITSDATSNEIDITWGSEASVGTICVVFTEDEGCESNEICMDIDLSVSSSSNILIKDFVIFPNPTSSIIMVQSEMKLFDQLIVTDISGRIIVHENFTKTSTKNIDLSEVVPGIYLLKVKTLSGYSVSKIIKE